MLATLALLYFSLSTFDTWITRKRLLSYGTQVEGNEIIRNLSTQMGPELGVGIGILLPSILLTLLLVELNWSVPLAGLIGYRLCMFKYQIQSLQFEREARKLKDTINSRSSQE